MIIYLHCVCLLKAANPLSVSIEDLQHYMRGLLASNHLYLAIGKAFLWAESAKCSLALNMGGADPASLSLSLSASKDTPKADLLVWPGLRKPVMLPVSAQTQSLFFISW